MKILFPLTILLGMIQINFSQAVVDSLPFGLFADPHYADKPNTGRCYRSTIEKVDTAITRFNQLGLPMLGMLGDYVDGYPGDDGNKTIVDLGLINAVVNKFTGDPYFVMGNHDFADLDKTRWLANTVGKIKQSYYSFNFGPIHFVVLDGNFLQDGTPYANSNFVWTDTWIPDLQRDWLIEDLDSSGTTPTIVFTHQNLQDVSSIGIKNSPAIRTILETHGNVIAAFQGHHHAGQYVEINGIHYVTIVGMISCPETDIPFATAVIKDDKLDITGYGPQPSSSLTHTGLLQAKWPVKGCMDSTYQDFNPDAEFHVQDSCKTPVFVKDHLSSLIFKNIKVTDHYFSILTTGFHKVTILNFKGERVKVFREKGPKVYYLKNIEQMKSSGMYTISVLTQQGNFHKKVLKM